MRFWRDSFLCDSDEWFKDFVFDMNEKLFVRHYSKTIMSNYNNKIVLKKINSMYEFKSRKFNGFIYNAK
jgi:hypothetical protein